MGRNCKAINKGLVSLKNKKKGGGGRKRKKGPIIGEPELKYELELSAYLACVYMCVSRDRG